MRSRNRRPTVRYTRIMRAWIGLISVSFAGAALIGCGNAPKATSPVVTIARGDYAKAFDAAVALVGDYGMRAELRDRDGGVIETRPKVSGSLIEPWNWPRGELGASLESSITFQRRLARFEFAPAGFRPTTQPEDAPLAGQRTPGTVPSDANGAIDLVAYDGPIDLRIWVYVERAFTPGLQRSAWTFSQTSFSTNALKNKPTGDETTRDRSIWTAYERDEAMEQQLTEELRVRLAGSSSS